MNIEVVDVIVNPGVRRVAFVLVRYQDLMMKCDLVYHPKNNKAWIRMPEMWVGKEEKKRFCYWINDEISYQFQESVLRQIFDKHDLNLKKVKELHASLKVKPKKLKKR